MSEDSILYVIYWLDYRNTNSTKREDIKLKCKQPSYKSHQNTVLNFVRSGNLYTISILLESVQYMSLIAVRNWPCNRPG